MKEKVTKRDANLLPFASDIQLRIDNYLAAKNALLQPGQTLSDIANGYLFFGIHRTENGWVYREWAPGADEMYFAGDFNGWNRRGCPMQRKENGVFEVFLQGKDALKNFQGSPLW